MQVQIVSDIHSEWHEDSGKEFVNSFPVLCDNLLIAGDIGSTKTRNNVLEQFGKKFKNVIFVLGNHDYYGIGFDVHNECESFKNTNIHWLYNNVIEIEGKKIAGNTLWFPQSVNADIMSLDFTDFGNIPDFRSWIYKENEKSQQFLRNCDADIVITHHVPTSLNIAPEYKMEPSNCFFVSEMKLEYWFEKTWIHGHTHNSFDTSIGDARIICNPLGYPWQINKNFTTKVWEI